MLTTGHETGRWFARGLREPHIKIKGLYGIFPASDRAVGHYDTYLSTWTPSHWTRQMDLAVSAGANTYATGSPLESYIYGTPQEKLLVLDRVRFKTEQAARRGLHVQWSMSFMSELDRRGATSFQQKTDAIFAVGQAIDPYPNVIVYDVVNEGVTGVNGKTNLEVFAGFRAAAKAATTLPVTFNVLGNDVTVRGHEPYCDVLSIHPYSLTPEQDPTTNPMVVACRSIKATTGKPWFIGELGLTADRPAIETRQRWAQMAKLAALPDCAGAVGFCITDFNATSADEQYGIYDKDFILKRQDILDIFRGWPNSR